MHHCERNNPTSANARSPIVSPFCADRSPILAHGRRLLSVLPSVPAHSERDPELAPSLLLLLLLSSSSSSIVSLCPTSYPSGLRLAAAYLSSRPGDAGTKRPWLPSPICPASAVQTRCCLDLLQTPDSSIPSLHDSQHNLYYKG